MGGTEHYLMLGQQWGQKAEENVEEWGIQKVDTLLLAIQEELGELTQAHLEARAEGGDPARVEEELADLSALCFQLQWSLNRRDVDTGSDRSGTRPEPE